MRLQKKIKLVRENVTLGIHETVFSQWFKTFSCKKFKKKNVSKEAAV